MTGGIRAISIFVMRKIDHLNAGGRDKEEP
jgi:hypothetical protein